MALHRIGYRIQCVVVLLLFATVAMQTWVFLYMGLSPLESPDDARHRFHREMKDAHFRYQQSAAGMSNEERARRRREVEQVQEKWEHLRHTYLRLENNKPSENFRILLFLLIVALCSLVVSSL